MRRLFWLGMGIAAGALAVRAVSRRVQAFTPSGMAGTVRDSASGLLDEVRTFVEDVRIGMAEREAEIREAMAGGVLLGADDETTDTGEEHR
jgi:hypothetical protein